MDAERTKRLLTQSVIKETISRLQNYLDMEKQPSKKEQAGLIIAARTIVVNSCRDTADFLAGEILLVTRGDAINANKAEAKVPILEAEVQALRKLVPKTKLKIHDDRKLLKEGKSD